MEVSHVNILSHLPLCLWNFSLLGFGESQRVGRDGGLGRVVVNEYDETQKARTLGFQGPEILGFC